MFPVVLSQSAISLRQSHLRQRSRFAVEHNRHYSLLLFASSSVPSSLPSEAGGGGARATAIRSPVMVSKDLFDFTVEAMLKEAREKAEGHIRILRQKEEAIVRLEAELAATRLLVEAERAAATRSKLAEAKKQVAVVFKVINI